MPGQFPLLHSWRLTIIVHSPEDCLCLRHDLFRNMSSGEVTVVKIVEHLLSLSVCSVCSIVLWANMRTLEWQQTVRAQTYFLLILSCLVVFALYNVVLTVFLWYEDLSYVPTTSTTVVEQSVTCSILAVVRVVFVSCTDWLTVLIVFETFRTVCWSAPTSVFSLRILQYQNRPVTYATVTFLGTLAQTLTIGLVVGFGRNNKGCSFKVTRPGGKPTMSEIMTYYGYNFTLFALIFLMQSYSVYYVSTRLGAQGSGAARRKKKAIACKMMALPIGLLVFWSFKPLRRIFSHWPAIAIVKLHLDRLQGFFTATLLLCFNNRFRKACWTFVKSNMVGKYICQFCSREKEQEYFLINQPEHVGLRESTGEGGRALLSFNPALFEDENNSNLGEDGEGLLCFDPSLSAENNEDENKSNIPTGELRVRPSYFSDADELDESSVVYSPPDFPLMNDTHE